MEQNDKIFEKRLDFYWQAILIYTIILIGFAFTKGTISNQSLGFNFNDPIVMLFGIFIIISCLSFLVSFVINKKIIIGDNHITVTTRFVEKRYNITDIKKIILSNRKKLQNRDSKKLVLIRIEGRRRALRIRPSAYWDDRDLFDTLILMKDKITATDN